MSALPCLATVPAGFEETLIVSGLASPTALSFAPDGRIFVCEQAGRLRIIKNGALLSQPFITLNVRSDGERGLLGVAFDPNFATNRWVYIYYTAAETGENRLSRFRASASNPDVVESGSEQYLLERLGIVASNHNGGAIHFGLDRMLYVAIGEHGSPSLAQDLRSLGGKLLRLNPANYPNIIPADNPFVGQAGARGEIWAYGLRNPYTFDIDPVGGKIYVNDVGQGAYEEVNQLARGANYGWPTCEGPCSPANAAMTNPIYYYAHPTGCAITGGAFYRGSQFPVEYSGDYFFADYCGNFVSRLRPGNTASSWGAGFGAPVNLAVGPDGRLYVLEYSNGRVTRIGYAGSSNRAPSAVISANPLSGPLPLTVSFNGSTSSDPDRDPLTYSWNFGDNTAVSTLTSPSHTYSTAGKYTARLTVSDGKGATGTASVTITAGNTPPTATITAPVSGARYRAGDTVTTRGTATDTEDGTLPASAYSWSVVFHHDTHTHPFRGPITGVTSDTFQIPQTGETAANVWYEILLTVRDSGGLTQTVSRNITPTVATITLQTSPAGLQVLLDGTAVTAPYSFSSVAGIQRQIGATSPRTLNGRTYQFVSWSDNGAQTHVITTPATATTYTATFREVAASRDTAPPVISAVSAGSITSTGAVIRWTTNEASDSKLEYGLTTSYGITTPLDATLVTSHSIGISGLKAGATYHYRVRSKDATGNLAVSGDSVFTTTTGTSTGGEVMALIRQSCAGYTNCYTSLAAWEAAYGGIAFGNCPAGDLVCANRSAVAQIDGAWTAADTGLVRLDGWTTGPANYIRIFTTAAARHTGKWDETRYRLVWGAGYASGALDIEENYVRIEGLQIFANQTSYYNNGIYVGPSVTGGDVRISASLIKGAAAKPDGNGILIETSAASAIVKVWNNAVYDFGTTGLRENTYAASGVPGQVYVHNNLFYGSRSGVKCRGAGSGGGRAVAIKNNISVGNTLDYDGSFSQTGNNLSRDASSPDTAYRSRTVSFAGEASRNFHLTATDAGARDKGLNLSADAGLAFTVDIDGQTRPATWDIGPDEVQ